MDRFERVNTQVLGISVDSKDCLHAWAESFGGITYPLLSDFWPHGQVAQKYGVLRSDGKSERAIFIIDRTGIIRYVDVHDIDEQPDNEVLFRELAEIEGVPVPQEIIPEAAARQPSPSRPGWRRRSHRRLRRNRCVWSCIAPIGARLAAGRAPI